MRYITMTWTTIACLMLTSCGTADVPHGPEPGLETTAATEITSNGTAPEKSPRGSNGQDVVAANVADKPSLPAVADASENDRPAFLKSFAPEVLGQYTLEDMLKKYPDADPGKITINPDGSQELIWGDNLVSHHATFYRDRLLGYRWKVIRGSREDAEAEMKRPIATLGPPPSTEVPDGEFDAVAWHQWLVEGYMVNTVVRRGATTSGIPVYYAERSVINWDRLNQILGK